MAGLLAARVLADHFEKIFLLEKDRFPLPGKNRKSVPQGKHIHVLLERGRRIMEKYLPGLTDELIHLGVPEAIDASKYIAWYHSGFHKPGESNIQGLGAARPTLEASVRRRVLSLQNVQAIENCKVLGLETTDNDNRVSGVRFKNSMHGNQEQTMAADLVVDACGRGSHSPRWLEKMGYHRPEEERVKIGIQYVTCFYRRKPDHIPSLKGIIYFATPSTKRFGVVLGQDGNRWVVTLGGYLGVQMPTDYPGFVQFSKELPTSHIYKLINKAERLTDPVSYKFKANLRRHYEKLSRFPEGYLVVGDALCSFNPVYGQGMTVASLEADALDNCLSEGHKQQLYKRFFQEASEIIDIPWELTVGNDLSFPEVEGRRTLMTRFLNWYIDKLQIAACKDAKVSVAFLKVINMLAPPPSILHPAIIWRIIKNHLFSAGYDTDQNIPENRPSFLEDD